MRRSLGLALVLALVGCAGEGLDVTDARVSEPFGNVAALYFEVENHAVVADRLIEVRTDSAEETRLHEMEIDADGFATMIDAEAFSVDPAGTLILQPGARHVMLLGVGPLAVGEVVEVELVWEHAGVMQVDAEVVPAGSGW